jgi:excinuclease ABC subunit A
VGDARHTLREGVVLAWGRRGSVALATELARAVETLGVSPDVAWGKLPEEQRKAILFGVPGKGRKKGYEGVVGRLEERLASLADVRAEDPEEGEDPDSSEGGIADDEIGRFLVTRRCDACKGKRLRPEALAVKLGDRDVAQVGSMPLRHVRKFVEGLGGDGSGQTFGPRESAIAEPLLKAVAARLGFLIDVGLDYLTLDRSAQTLSSGEGQRIRLATQIGAALVGVLYVLDEPSVGLHARDNARLIEAQSRLRDLGNTVLVVEHDREAILSADHVVDMGPGAGVHGGEIVAQGTPRELMANPKSITGPWLSGKRQLPVPSKRKGRGKQTVRVVGARAHNLRDVTAEVPLGLFTCVTGVSGSGKSSLVVDTLLPAARAKLYNATAPVGECDRVEGLDHVDKVVSIDQAPIGRTPRSNPATYTGIFALLRDLYAGLPDARARGYKAGRFSFNVKGGRCEACQGDGVLRVEMHFLPDVFVTCDACAGRRYNRETLEVKYRGLSIADALDVTVEQATELFGAVPRIADKLEALRKVGLGYLTLGQPATTLSGGEAQRVKLARELARKATGRTLYVLDEPTTGLHFADIEVLLTALTDLRDQGNTIVVIEHNLDVVACADWVIDLGPEGGEGGGEIVAVGTPEHVAQEQRSHTGKYLAEVLARSTPTHKKAARG